MQIYNECPPPPPATILFLFSTFHNGYPLAYSFNFVTQGRGCWKQAAGIWILALLLTNKQVYQSEHKMEMF